MGALQLERDGFEPRPGLADELLERLEGALSSLPSDKAGVRIVDCPALAQLLSRDHAIGASAAAIIGERARPVRAVLFDKSPQANWTLDWHQDRTIAVQGRIEVPGFGNWNVKQGILHVEPPFAIMEQMLTVRIHLDQVSADNGVLEVIAGSHRYGRLAEGSIAAVVAAGPVETCPAQRGDCWFYRTPILHRSARSRSSARRRVLQVDYCAAMLPDGMEWRGI